MSKDPCLATPIDPRLTAGPLREIVTPYPATADVEHGKALYASTCASCHGSDGAGVGKFPPVWGPKSYNSGAGLAQNLKLATYLKNAMPLGNPNLSDKDALDIAAYVNAQPRPKFVLEEHLGKGK